MRRGRLQRTHVDQGRPQPVRLPRLDAGRAVRRGLQDLDADRQCVRDLVVPPGRGRRCEPHQRRQGTRARSAGSRHSEQRARSRVRSRWPVPLVHAPPGRLRLQPGAAGVGDRDLRPADRQGVQSDRSVRERDASCALTGREMAGVRDAVRCGDGTAPPQSLVGRRAVAGLPGAARRPGIPLHARPDARRVVYARLQGAGRVVRREDLACRGAVRPGDRGPVHGQGAPGPRDSKPGWTPARSS